MRRGAGAWQMLAVAVLLASEALRCPSDGSSVTYTGRTVGGVGQPTRYEYRCDLTGATFWDGRQPW